MAQEGAYAVQDASFASFAASVSTLPMVWRQSQHWGASALGGVHMQFLALTLKTMYRQIA